MATRQYIGARYTPKFSGTYDATQAYEALEVVDNGSGTTYIARQPVPPNTPLTNTTYWLVYGSSSGAILDLQSRVGVIENTDIPNINGSIMAIGGRVDTIEDTTIPEIQGDISDLQDEISDISTENITVVVGDSWADQTTYSSYPTRVGWLHDRMEANPNIKCYAVSGTGMTNVVSQLTQAKNDTSFNNKSVKNIIIITGVNDFRTNTAASAIINAGKEIKAYAASNFPAAKIVNLFDSYSPNSVTGSTAFNCYSLFNNVVDSLPFPSYYLGLYLVVASDYETASSGSFHPSAQGGVYIGKIFDQILADQTPNMARDTSKFAAAMGYSKVYSYSGTTPTNRTNTMGVCSQAWYTVGNSCELVYQIDLGSTAFSADVIAVQFNLSSYNASQPLHTLFRTMLGVGYNSSSRQNMLQIQPQSSLFTGTYNGITYENAQFYYLSDNTKAINVVEFRLRNRIPVQS